MVDISRETHEANSVETIVDNDGTLCLSEKHRQGGLYHKNLQVLQQNIFQTIENLDEN